MVKWEFADSRQEDKAVLEEVSDLALGGGTSDPMSITSDGHRLQIADLADAIRTGRDPHIPGGDGRHAIHLIECIYQSAKTGKPVAVDR